MKPAGVPISTYRVQFNKDFRFLDCRDIVPYLHMLGIGALYSSPRFRARRGSEHGYDVASPLRVNSELGTDDEFNDLCSKLRHYGMGLILDIVPNHMAASHENPWWMDVLENGPSSPYAHYFDIDWHPATSKAAFLQENKILLPVLEDLYGDVLQGGQLSLGLDEAGFFLRYGERRIPLDPKSYGLVLDACRDRLARDLGVSHPSIAEVEQVRRLVDNVPPRTASDPGEIPRRLHEGQAVKQRVFELYREHLEPRLAMDAALREVSASFELLHPLLEDQAYRLAFWKIAFEEINYRRFFDVNDLVCLRVEDEDVFAARHQIIFQLVAEGNVTGLRVDHVDGLHDPEGYLARLQAAAGQVVSGAPVYVVVEKVLGREESLPGSWQTCGTTGYDFLNALNGLFVEPAGLREIEAAYSRFTGQTEPFSEVCYARNKQVMGQLFAGEVNALGHQLGKLAALDLQARDVPLSELKAALVEVTACLPIYRTYIRSFEVSPPDGRCLERTLELARRRTSDSQIGTPAFDFLRRVLLLEPAPYAKYLQSEYLRFVMRWQQFTGPVMAKGLEDTAYYVHNSLISMNEVGGDPLREAPPLDLAGFHKFQRERLRLWPYSMNATSTHDTKRGEDVRARINVLSEIPEEWEKHLLRWRRLNQRHKTEVHGIPVPAPSEEVLLYQTLLGAWPLDPSEEETFSGRVQEFLKKAVREAKIYSGWIRPDEAHEDALWRFADSIFRTLHTESGPFRQDFLRFQRKIAWHGALNSLSQVLIKITVPGVPDFYQGSELWDLSMVDPDNRRPVDFRRRIQMLEEIRTEHSEHSQRLLRDMLLKWQDGRIKLYLTDRALDFRRAHAEVYLEGDYTPLAVRGPKQASVCAFARHRDEHWCVTVAPRLTTQLVAAGRMPLGRAVWRETSLQLPEAAPESWHNVLTGDGLTASPDPGGLKTLALAEVLKRFPIALLSRAE
jgi:(1->4)-alpha-D-glucan 1-alpha-D-glucosylmutase